MKKKHFGAYILLFAVAILLVTSGCFLDSRGLGAPTLDQPGLKGNYALNPEIRTTNCIAIWYGGDGVCYSGIGWGLGVSDFPWGFTGDIMPRGEYTMDIGLQFESVGTDGAYLGDDIVEGVILYTPPEEGEVVEEIHFRLRTDGAETFVLVRIPDSD